LTFFAVAVNKFRTDQFHFNTGCLRVYVELSFNEVYCGSMGVGEFSNWADLLIVCKHKLLSCTFLLFESEPAQTPQSLPLPDCGGPRG